MNTAVLLTLLFALIPSVLLGQENQTLEGTLRDVSKDLATLNQQVQEASRAQSTSAVPRNYDIVITNKQTSIRAGADDKASVLTHAPEGSSWSVVDKAGRLVPVALDKPTKGISTGWVKAANAAPQLAKASQLPSAEERDEKSLSDRIYEQIVAKITAIRDKYKDNKYVRVSGFTVNVGVPPSVSVSFEFVK